jgi:hypothetical protein
MMATANTCICNIHRQLFSIAPLLPSDFDFLLLDCVLDQFPTVVQVQFYWKDNGEYL